MAKKQIIVIGGGAAGFFAAIQVAERHPDYRVIILEKSRKLLTKVRISGGGRCNVSNQVLEVSELVKNYPRGSKELVQVFNRFDVQDTVHWFELHGVKLKTESDGRMFPVTDSSETIIDCFLNEARRLKIKINVEEEVISVSPSCNRNSAEYEQLHDEHFVNVQTNKQRYAAHAVICSAGGSNTDANYNFIKKAGHTIQAPIPSLFTFNLKNEKICDLMGLSVKNVSVKIGGMKYSCSGPLLITHWGFSGPAVLKLSAFAAKDIYNNQYIATIFINWTGNLKEDEIKSEFLRYQDAKSLVVNTPLFGIPKRLWEYLITRVEIPSNNTWQETGKKLQNRLVNLLHSDEYQMKGKTTFKEEFVTCGGVTLKEVDFKTMQSKIVPNLYFCGEVLDIDGITGGFNFQNAWSTAFVAASSVV